ncbi:N-hydroxyarylamine O-acetyltransferase [Salmonella enterica subsp. enterica serovar Sanjuan]|uniref:N-hydroxyarylamine O-acetyltransferase n=1 Tax=Salmonella enterica subsp. enterica serovar Sanjuan TaxID=1160765 RepID=A0A447NTU9_SALET|nr:N-hydroxyarylamine O-acetyltransferase [Salmonella enterica subsp. enterica serovar Sanjuan]
MTSFLHAYFTRLNCQPLGVPTVEALRTLHLAHNCAIPFENLDVLLPREIQLDETALEEKLLYARRGGYCFELNGLFERAFTRHRF